jgi:hypothetical protein
MAAAHQAGETLAATRTRLDPAALNLLADLVSTDIWADTSRNGVTARPSIAIRYTGNTDAADNLATAAPVNGIINYPDHIQPLWTRDRGANTCTNCHTDPARLDLRQQVMGTGRLGSYEELLLGDPVIDPATGLPRTSLRDGVPMLDRAPALVENMASEGDAGGLARKSRLGEIMFGQALKAGEDSRNVHPAPPESAPDHAAMLNVAEKRLIAEWMDLGGQYYNDPFDANSGVRTLSGPSQASFDSTVFPILQASCASCHQAVGSTSVTPVGGNFRNNRFVLTGDREGDFGVSLSMVSCTNPTTSYLLAKPSSAPHPAGAAASAPAPLPVGSANYNTIAAWIAAGCS